MGKEMPRQEKKKKKKKAGGGDERGVESFFVKDLHDLGQEGCYYIQSSARRGMSFTGSV